jgi:hypothetical protein
MKNDTDRLLGEILVDAYGEDEQLWAFRRHLRMRCRCQPKRL